MKYILILTLCCTFFSVADAAVYTFNSTGDWTDESNWDVYPGTTIESGDEVFIIESIIVNAFVSLDGHIEVENGITMTIDWPINISDVGTITNNGNVENNTQINLFGECISNGTWENTETGTLIITSTGAYYSYDDFTNNGSILGYIGGKLYMESNLDNNGSFTFSGDIELNHNNGSKFTNSDFVQLNGTLRLEGDLVNNLGNSFNINWSCNMVIADNSKIENYGIIRIDGDAELSSMINANSTLGNVIIKGILEIKTSILEVL